MDESSHRGWGHVAMNRPPHRGTRGVTERLVYCRDSQVTGSRAHRAESKSQNGIPSGQLNHANSPEFRSSGQSSRYLACTHVGYDQESARRCPARRSARLEASQSDFALSRQTPGPGSRGGRIGSLLCQPHGRARSESSLSCSGYLGLRNHESQSSIRWVVALYLLFRSLKRSFRLL